MLDRVLDHEDRMVVVKFHVPACLHPVFYRVSYNLGAFIRMRQRNAPSAREASVMKWGNERKTNAWESSAAAEPCRSGATGRRIRYNRRTLA